MPVLLPSRLVPPLLRLTRANRPFRTAAGARDRVRERELRPASYGPPRRLRPDVTVDVRRGTGWPVYTLRPRRPDPQGSVVYLHGGGWVHEVVTQHWQLAARIAAEAHTTVTVPVYPLVPFGTAAAVADGVVELVRQNRDTLGPTALAGDSAGGQIALSAALRLRDAGTTLPATVLISPALDLSLSNPQIPRVLPTDPWLGVDGGRVLAGLWSGGLDLTDPVVSPLFGDLAGLGPLTVFTGTRDILNPDAHLLAERAAAAGVAVDLHEVAGQVHVYPLLPTAVGAQARDVLVEGLRVALPPG